MYRTINAQIRTTEDIKAAIRADDAAGLSTSETAQRLGLSRNAVCGHRYRMGLKMSPDRPSRAKTPKPPPSKRRAPLQRKRLKAASQSTPAPIATHLPAIRPIPFAELQPHHCRWPIGDPGQRGFGYCGQPIDPDAPQQYCCHHQRISSGKVTSNG